MSYSQDLQDAIELIGMILYQVGGSVVITTSTFITYDPKSSIVIEDGITGKVVKLVPPPTTRTPPPPIPTVPPVASSPDYDSF